MKRNVEIKLRRLVERIIREESTDIRKVDKSNLASTASHFLNALSRKGFTGKYNPDEARGVVELNGIEIHFTTGDERIYFEISKFSIESPDANFVIGKLIDIFKVAESGLLFKPKRSKKSAVKEYYDDDNYDDPVASAKTKGIRTYKDSGDAEADAIEYVGGPREWAKLTRAEKEDILFDMEKGKMQSYRF